MAKKNRKEARRLVQETLDDVESKKVLSWDLLKGGLSLPKLHGKSAEDCVHEGLRLISNSLFCRQDQKLNSLQVYTDKSKKKDSGGDSDKLAKIRSTTFMRRQTSLIKFDKVQSE